MSKTQDHTVFISFFLVRPGKNPDALAILTTSEVIEQLNKPEGLNGLEDLRATGAHSTSYRTEISASRGTTTVRHPGPTGTITELEQHLPDTLRHLRDYTPLMRRAELQRQKAPGRSRVRRSSRR